MRVVWLNGSFGVGKTTTAAHLLGRLGQWRYFDPETVGYMLRGALADLGRGDFQDLRAWRTLVPQVVAAIGAETGQDVVAVQTVLNRDYWDEMHSSMTGVGIEVFHVVLDCDDAELVRRIGADGNDPGARQWRLDHVGRYDAARQWLFAVADMVVDTTTTGPGDVAAMVAGHDWVTSTR